MTVRIDLKQTKTVEEGPLYRVHNQVTYAHEIPQKVFVFNVETGEFDHVATVWDLQSYPFTKDEAILEHIPYYLASECSREYPDIQSALDFTSYVYSRIEWLVRDYKDATGVFTGVLTHSVRG